MRAWFHCNRDTLLTPAHHLSARPPCPFLPSHFPAGWLQPARGLRGLFPRRYRALHSLFLSCMRFQSAHLPGFLGPTRWWPCTPAYLPLLPTWWGSWPCWGCMPSPFHIANEDDEWDWLQWWPLRMLLVSSCRLHWGPLMMLSQFFTYFIVRPSSSLLFKKSICKKLSLLTGLELILITLYSFTSPTFAKPDRFEKAGKAGTENYN